MQVDIRVLNTFESSCKLEETSRPIINGLKKLGDKKKKEIRKFVLLQELDNIDRLILVIGPALDGELYDESAYRHHVLYSWATSLIEDNKRYEIKGGGDISFRKPTDTWLVMLGGLSGDYGVYDERLLSKRQEIANWFQMRVNFSWTGNCSPEEKK